MSSDLDPTQMDPSQLDPSQMANLIPPPPPGTNYLASIEISLNTLMISTSWSSALVPLLCALFYFSTKKSRRSPIFLLNLISVLIGLAFGALNVYVQVTSILHPEIALGFATFTAIVLFLVVAPLFTESILLLRVYAVYPPRQLSRLAVALVYLPPILFKLARLGNSIAYMVIWLRPIHQGGNELVVSQSAWDRPQPKIEWFLRIFDDGYVSFLFLLKLHRERQESASISKMGRSSFAKRLNSLFWIAASNFVIPVMLTFVQLVLAFTDTSYLHGSYIVMTNTYVDIVGVLLATIWAAGATQAEKSHLHTGSTSGTSSNRVVLTYDSAQTEMTAISRRGDMEQKPHALVNTLPLSQSRPGHQYRPSHGSKGHPDFR